MNEITKIQNQLLHEIFKVSNDRFETDFRFEKKGLEIYRRNLRATALRSLEISFPTVSALIGADLMKYATEKMLQNSPPKHGDWSQWGEEFGDVLTSIPELNDFPFVPDCARLDFIVHQLYRSADSNMDSSSLNLLRTFPASSLIIEPNSNLRLLRSLFPLVEIWKAHQDSEEESQVYLDMASEKLKSSQESFIAVTRVGNIVDVVNVSNLDFQWYSLLRQGSIENALSQIDQNIFSFEQWLADALSKGLIKCIKLTEN